MNIIQIRIFFFDFLDVRLVRQLAANMKTLVPVMLNTIGVMKTPVPVMLNTTRDIKTPTQVMLIALGNMKTPMQDMLTPKLFIKKT